MQETPLHLARLIPALFLSALLRWGSGRVCLCTCVPSAPCSSSSLRCELLGSQTGPRKTLSCKRGARGPSSPLSRGRDV